MYLQINFHRQFVILISVISLSISQNELKSLIFEGKQRYDDLSQKVSLFGNCWKSALIDLHIGCRELTEDVQSRLALSFANCFLENSGSPTCVCSSDMSVSQCLRNADDRIFSTYREFFTHTRSICYFLQHQIWQENTENTIQKLSVNSKKVSHQLEKSTKAQATVLHLQQISLNKQQELINKSETGLQNLNVELEKSHSNAKAVLDEFKSTTNEQRLLIFAIFDHVKKLENLVVGEFTGIFTYVYYFLAVILCYVLTSARQTASARIWLFLLFSLNFLTEKLIILYIIEDETHQHILLQSDGPLYYRIWWCRKAFCAVSFLLLMVTSLRYKDYNIINNHLLLDIQQQHVEIQRFIKSIRDSPHNAVSADKLSEVSLFQKSPKEYGELSGATLHQVHNIVAVQTIQNAPLEDSSQTDATDSSARDNSERWWSKTKRKFKFRGYSFSTKPIEANYVNQSDAVQPVTIDVKESKPSRARSRKKLSFASSLDGSTVSNDNCSSPGIDDSWNAASPNTRYNLRRRQPSIGQGNVTSARVLSKSIEKAAKASEDNYREVSLIMKSLDKK